MDNVTSSLLAPTVTGGIVTSETTQAGTLNKYDVININFETDIKPTLLSKIDNAYSIKGNLFGADFSVVGFNDKIKVAIAESMQVLAQIKALGINDVSPAVDADIKKIVRNSAPIKASDASKTNEPHAFLDPTTKTLNLVLGGKLYKAMDRHGVTSINGKPPRGADDIVKGSTDIAITLEEINAIEDNKPATPSVALGNKFVSLVSQLKNASTTTEGITKFASLDEIKNKQKTDSAVSPKDVITMINDANLVADIGTGNPLGYDAAKEYAYKAGTGWVEYKQSDALKRASDTTKGITRLATDAEITTPPTGENVATTYAQAISYIESTYPDAFTFPPYSNFFYAAVNPVEYKKKFPDLAPTQWVRIYNDSSNVPEASEQFYGLSYIATNTNISAGTPGARVLTPKSLNDYLAATYPSFTGQITDGDAYVVRVANKVRSFVKFDDAVKDASETLYGKTKLANGTDATLNNVALTPAGADTLIKAKYPNTNTAIDTLGKLEADDIYARKQGKFIKIGGKIKPATTKTYGVVEIAAASADKAAIENNKSKKVVSQDDMTILEKALDDYYAKLPQDGKTYLFKNDGGKLGFVETDLDNLSHFKTVMLDENNQVARTSYRTAVHVLNNTTDMATLTPADTDYSVNLAQIIAGA